MSQAHPCPECGAEIPAGAPAGQCPQCLMKAGFQSEASLDSHIEPTAPSPGSAGFEPPSVDHLAKLFPQLEILELLGRGGMGAVYKARQPGLNRLVAVKILPPEVGRDPAFAQRFTREAQALAHLSHPNIVAVHDFGQADGLFYFVMEFVDGLNLRQAMQASKLSSEEALAIVPQICDALQFAHDEGVVHRDIKPENILLDTRGRVKIADFGLSKLMASGERKLAENAMSLTGTEQVMGTLRYMAPEQMQGTKTVDHRADIYSLGVVFYELLTGEVPMGRFEPPSRRVQVDVRLDEIVLRSLEREPDRRYQRASEVKTDVQSVASNPAIVATRRTVADNSPAPEVDLDAARQEVKIPAVGLMLSGVLMCAFVLASLCGGGLLLNRLLLKHEGQPDVNVRPPADEFLEQPGLVTQPYEASPETTSEPTESEETPPARPAPKVDGTEQSSSGGSTTSILLASAAMGVHVQPPADAPMWFVLVAILAVVSVAMSLGCGVVITLAGWRMMRLKSHGLAVTGSILALLPCQPVFPLSLIFGIWSLMVLNRPHIKAAFGRAAKLPADAAGRGTVDQQQKEDAAPPTEAEIAAAGRRIRKPMGALLIVGLAQSIAAVVLIAWLGVTLARIYATPESPKATTTSESSGAGSTTVETSQTVTLQPHVWWPHEEFIRGMLFTNIVALVVGLLAMAAAYFGSRLEMEDFVWAICGVICIPSPVWPFALPVSMLAFSALGRDNVKRAFAAVREEDDHDAPPRPSVLSGWSIATCLGAGIALLAVAPALSPWMVLNIFGYQVTGIGVDHWQGIVVASAAGLAAVLIAALATLGRLHGNRSHVGQGLAAIVCGIAISAFAGHFVYQSVQPPEATTTSSTSSGFSDEAVDELTGAFTEMLTAGIQTRPSFGGYAAIACGALLALVGAGQLVALLMRKRDNRHDSAGERKSDVETPASKPAIAVARKPDFDDTDAIERELAAARQEVKAPAIGLMVIGLLTAVAPLLFVAPLLVYWAEPFQGDGGSVPQNRFIIPEDAPPVSEDSDTGASAPGPGETTPTPATLEGEAVADSHTGDAE